MLNYQRALNLLDQIMEIEVVADKEYRARMIAEHQAAKTVGESWRLFHLKNLRELLLNINSTEPNNNEHGAYDNKIA